jgi:outer membrane lipoprotein
MNTLPQKHAFFSLLLALLLCACASTAGPSFDTAGVIPALTPSTVVANPMPAMGKSVQWGGTITGITNQPDRTLIDVLAYPLDSTARPGVNSNPLGRFILEQQGFLDPAIYKQGRRISAVGTVTGTRTTQVGDTSQDQPVVDARQIYLWPEDPEYGSPGVTFGVGVGTWGSGTNWGTGVGIGF